MFRLARPGPWRITAPCICLLLLLSSLSAPTFAKAPPSDSSSTIAAAKLAKPSIPLFPPVWNDLAYLFSERDFYYTVGGLLLAPGVFPGAFKQESPEFTELWGPSQFADDFFEGGEILGSGVLPMASSVALIGIGKIGHAGKVQAFGSDLFRASLVTGLFSTAMKGAVNRVRPDGAPYSYPSGHTSSAFVTAGVVYKHFGKTWGIPAMALASYVGFSRLQENKHYMSDVIAGAVLGTYMAFKLSGRDGEGKSLSIAPSPHGAGLAVSLKF